MVNPFINIYKENIDFAQLLYRVIFDYTLSTYKYKNQNILETMFNYKIIKILSYVDSESPLYDCKMFTGSDIYESVYNIVTDVFSNKYWNDLKEIEKKRLSVQSTKEPNTNIICKKCKKESIYVYEKQVRCSDEAMTQFYSCLNCGNKWSF